jgi:hypothetical protein
MEYFSLLYGYRISRKAESGIILTLTGYAPYL